MIRCEKDFTVDGRTICGSKYSSGGKVNYGILISLGHQYCNQCCKYCVCHPAATNVDTYQYYKKDYDKMIQLIKETDAKRKVENGLHTFELWGGEPLFNFRALKELVSVLRSEWPDCNLSTSTNGLLLMMMRYVTFLLKIISISSCLTMD